MGDVDAIESDVTQMCTRACAWVHFVAALLLGAAAASPTPAPTIYVLRTCPPGSMANGLDQCEAVWPGHWSNDTGAINATRCDAGTACPRGALAPVACRAETYSPRDALSECLACAPGAVAERAGATVCDDCAAGRFATLHWSLALGAAALYCAGCVPGFAAPTARGVLVSGCAPCRAGFYAPAPNATNCAACPSGRWSASASGATSCAACTAWRRSTAGAEGGATSCAACPLGRWAPAQTGASTCVRCSAAHYASANFTACWACRGGEESNSSVVAQAALSGATLPPGAQCVACARGRYRPAMENAEHVELCHVDRLAALHVTPVPGGVNEIGWNFTTALCACQPAPTGRWAPERGANASRPCPLGRACGSPGMMEGSLCAPGTFAPATGLSRCLDCAPGSATSTREGATACTACAAGRRPVAVLGTAGASECAACEAGRFAEASGSALCAAAPPGRYVAGLESTSAGELPNYRYKLCESFSHCDSLPLPSIFDSHAALCPAGHLCAGPAASLPVPCPLGQYAPAVGHASCIACRGTFSNGSYTPSSGSLACASCSKGRFALRATQTACVACDAARFAARDAATACAHCAGGSHAVAAGSTTCVTCEAGTFLSMNTSMGWTATSNW